MSSLGKKGRMFYKDLGGEHHQSQLVLGVEELFLHISSHCSHSLILSGGMERNSYWVSQIKQKGEGQLPETKTGGCTSGKFPSLKSILG